MHIAVHAIQSKGYGISASTVMNHFWAHKVNGVPGWVLGGAVNPVSHPVYYRYTNIFPLYPSGVLTSFMASL